MTGQSATTAERPYQDSLERGPSSVLVLNRSETAAPQRFQGNTTGRMDAAGREGSTLPGPEPDPVRGPTMSNASGTVRTRAAAKAGSTDYRLTVHATVPLDDPHAWGNCGLEGRDDVFESRTFPTLGLAKAGVAKLAAKIVRENPTAEVWDDLSIEEGTWERESFDDRVYGHVIDAIREPVRVLHGRRADDGTVTWDAEWSRP